MRPKVSILIPVYNVENFLRRCLDSVAAQTEKDIEVVCVNDASTDGSMDILKECAAADSRFRIVDKPVNEGLMMARHTGYKAAQGEYFFFLDSDDHIPPRTIELLYAEACKSDADITVGNMSLLYSNGNTISNGRSSKVGKSADSYLRSILSWGSTSLCGSLFRRSLFEGKGYIALPKQSFSEDRLLLTEILVSQKPSVSSIPDCTYIYCMQDASITHRNIDENVVKNQFSALFRCYNYVRENAPEFAKENEDFIIRRLNIYIEMGCAPAIKKHFAKETESILKFDHLRSIVGPVFAAHIILCMRVGAYRKLMLKARETVRKLKGKD